MKKKISAIILLAFTFTLVASFAAMASPAAEVASVLDTWTSSHWGNDCFVWVARYTEDLAGPWADLAVEKGAVAEEDRDSYVESFKAELKMSTREPILVSITSFAGRNLELAPFEERIFIVDSRGNRSGPVSYDEAFERPVPENVRGLVFFPAQEGPFRILIEGLGLNNGGRFEFSGFDRILRESEPDEGAEQEKKEGRPAPGLKEGVIVISPSEDRKDRAGKDKDEPDERAEIPQTEDVEQVGPEKSDEAEEVKPIAVEKEDKSSDPSEKEQAGFRSRDLLLKSFLEKWISGDYEGMYALLSDESRKKVSRSVFTSNAMQSPFRIILMNGYTYKWENETTAVVSSQTELGIMQGLGSKKIKVSGEGNGWTILW